ncbi:MAG TPA: putative quinol monooxygenase [Clostridiaceae bacterium]|jgi:quinol monooxygenase YgiN|nr:putative quinol monooxygenase [Clostridiaceae bacterium]
MKLVSKRIVKEGQVDCFINIFTDLTGPSRAEKGCLSYELFQDQKDPRVFAIIEEWADQEALDMHKKEEHFVKIVPMLDELTEKKLDFNIYDKVV